MNQTDRRIFLKQAGIAALTAAIPNFSTHAQSVPRVVVIGGGFGGATVSKYLRFWGGQIHVTMVEPQPLHYSCILSNGVVTGDYGLDRVTLGYDALQNRHGVEWVQGKALNIDPDAQQVTVKTSSGRVKLSYDKLVVSPGVDFVKPLGNYKAGKTPHAWKAGSQTTNLKNKLHRMRDGGVFVLRIPKAPYRCPP
ncbi:MAG: FAD-dependent oxidoreductase, partial [bacterium]